MGKKKKIFVLDTSVLLHDHQAILNFEKHDIVIPITVLEELDNFKVGNDTKNFTAREVIRLIDRISAESKLNDWISLGKNKGKFQVAMSKRPKETNAENAFSSHKNDHKILNAALYVKESHKTKPVILVSKDINLRIKSKALGLPAEDYETGKVKGITPESDGHPTINEVDNKFIQNLFNKNSLLEEGILGNHKQANGHYILKSSQSSTLAFYNPLSNEIEKVDKNFCYGIKPKNAEQAFAVNALLKDHIKLIVLQGVAGTGKTLLALASALEQQNKYQQIILARPLIPLSNRDIGFLPGDANDKISPYMEPLWDNLKFIKNQFKSTEKKHKSIVTMEEEGKILITPLAFIRGRSLSNVIFIIDEAQNLTPHEVKTIITRAGENTKIIFTGDLNQIDTPYLDENSNGLAYLIDRVKNEKLFAHIFLKKGERSELANLANTFL